MKKNYLKTNIISFIIGVVIFSCIGVYAVVNFPSNDVTYDNKESGLKSTSVKDAIDELYTECTKEPTAGETIIENAGLEKDPYECRYFFTGADPNNYITFNDETAGWRIISVECDGTIKIMNDNVGLWSWDTNGSTDWNRPASLNTYLNETYYNSLSSEAQSQIVAKDFSVGAVAENNNDLANQINNENSTLWNGKIAMPTVSEYLRSSSNKSKCDTIQLYNDNYTTCNQSTWMYISYPDWWTLSTLDNSSFEAFIILRYYGISYNMVTRSSYGVRPTLYLSSNIKITSGTGTSQDPYQISL